MTPTASGVRIAAYGASSRSFDSLGLWMPEKTEPLKVVETLRTTWEVVLVYRIPSGRLEFMYETEAEFGIDAITDAMQWGHRKAEELRTPELEAVYMKRGRGQART